MRTFRILAALMMAVVCVGLSSCSKDDDEKIGSTDNIVGVWTITSDEGWELHEGEKMNGKMKIQTTFLSFIKMVLELMRMTKSLIRSHGT